MSARIDLLPKAYTQTLSRLQDEVPPADFAAIRAQLIEELGAPPETLFHSFNEVPLASASFGQVHEAVLKEPFDGHTTDVAIKIQYPNIQSIVETDLKAIHWVTRILQKILTHIHFDILFREFSRMVHRELNYITEAKNTQRFREKCLEDSRIVVPNVVWQYTTQRVLTQTRLYGIKINRLDLITQAGISPQAVAQLLVESYMKQIMIYRFFHGDPHPGNLFVQPWEEGVDTTHSNTSRRKTGKFKLVFVDFGLMQEIDQKTDRGIQNIILGIIHRDIPKIARSLIELGFITRAKGYDIESVVQFFMDRYRDISPRAFHKITLSDIGEDLKTLFTLYPALQVPNLFILAGRAVGMLNGLCSQLDPDINIIELAQPYAKQFSTTGRATEWLSKGKEILRAFLSLPESLQSFIDLAHQGGVETHMRSESLERALVNLYKLAYRTVLGLTFAGAFFYIRMIPTTSLAQIDGIFAATALLLSGMALLTSFIRP